MPIDLEKLEAMSVLDRHNTWLNAKAKIETHAGAKELLELIESSGLDYAKDKIKSVSLDDPVGRAMKRVIGSEAGVRAMLQATEQGLPALAGVDPLLQEALGENYGKHNEATSQAGFLVAGFMEAQGYVKNYQAPMPPNCIAETGCKYKKIGPQDS